MIRSSLLQSTNRLHLECLPQCQNRSPQLPTVPIQQLPQCNRLQINCSYCVASVVRIGRLCSYYVIKRICTIFYEFKNSKIRDFLRIVYTEVTNYQSMQPTTHTVMSQTHRSHILSTTECLSRPGLGSRQHDSDKDRAWTVNTVIWIITSESWICIIANS